MASSTETIFWPFAGVLGLAFIIATIVMLSQAERDVQFHTSEQLSHTTARSTLYTFLNSQHNGGNKNGPMSNYRSISICYSGKNRGLDRRAVRFGDNVPDILRWTRVNATRNPGWGDCGPNIMKVGETGSRSSNSLNTGGPKVYTVKIPVRGGSLMTVTMEYEADAGALS